MKVRIGQNELRFRVDEDELSSLRAMAKVTCDVGICAEHTLKFVLRCMAGGERKLSLRNEAITLDLPAPEVEELIQSLPSKKGLEWRLIDESGRITDVSFEVDVRDSVHKRGPKKKTKN